MLVSFIYMKFTEIKNLHFAYLIYDHKTFIFENVTIFYFNIVPVYFAGVLIYEMLAGYPPFFDDNPFGIYEKILAGKIEWTRFIDPIAKDLIKKLLVQDRTKRLGNMKVCNVFQQLYLSVVQYLEVPQPT